MRMKSLLRGKKKPKKKREREKERKRVLVRFVRGHKVSWT